MTPIYCDMCSFEIDTYGDPNYSIEHKGALWNMCHRCRTQHGYVCLQCHDNAPAKGFDLCGHCIGSNLHFGHESLDDYSPVGGAQAEAEKYLAAFRRELAGNLHNATMRVAV